MSRRLGTGSTRQRVGRYSFRVGIRRSSGPKTSSASAWKAAASRTRAERRSTSLCVRCRPLRPKPSSQRCRLRAPRSAARPLQSPGPARHPTPTVRVTRIDACTPAYAWIGSIHRFYAGDLPRRLQDRIRRRRRGRGKAQGGGARRMSGKVSNAQHSCELTSQQYTRYGCLRCVAF